VLIPKHFAFLVLILLFAAPCHSTTVIIMVTQSGITIGSDSQFNGTGIHTGGTFDLGKAQGSKIAVVKDRIVVASIGFSRGSFMNGVDYDFATWINRIQGDLPDETSIDTLVPTIKAESAHVFSMLSIGTGHGGPQQHNATDMLDTFVEYLIVGYQGGTPTIRVIKYYIDWNLKKLLDPYVISIEPRSQREVGMRLYFYGVREAVTDARNPQSYAYKRTMAICPQAFQDLLTSRPLSLDEAATLVRAFIQIEEEVSPETVGGDVRCVQVLPTDWRASECGHVSSKPKAPKKGAHAH
jgi:hypothetical protein